ncbi:hypothetical protein QOZ80_3BG0280140 [Eleusine coracana subsp. coracana]|nr:hypothetical protein QOZ80_3BG0280140 [Eleusine coracana subsp. coracana]
MGVATVTELKQSISGKRTFRPSLITRHANEWPPTDVSSDLTVEVGTSSFALHKLLAQFPLVSRSGKIRRLVAESKDAKLARLSLHGTPGGAAAFELAAKFCYGVHVEVTASNVATLRCAAQYLQMSEDLCDKNLELRAESFLREHVLPSIQASVAVLRSCEPLLPAAEDVGLVSRLVAAIATNVCKEQLASGLSSKLDHMSMSSHATTTNNKLDLDSPAAGGGEWWGKSVAGLGLELFQRVLSAVKAKGLKQETVTRILINYAQNSLLQGLMARTDVVLHPPHGGNKDADAVKRQQRAVVEAIVGLLPAQSRKSPVPMAFLSGLLKTAMAVSASSICLADLEKRIGMQLDQAILEDVLVAAGSGSVGLGSGNGTDHHGLYDTDVVARIFAVFLNLDSNDDGGNSEDDGFDYDSPRSPKQSILVKAAKLLDSYLAEVALDSNLLPSKFISLAELLPDHARLVTDGLYRAVDIFLKVHPNIKEAERYRLCKAIDCQRLTPDACSHAAQNERLPVQMAVQVLYFEQLRLRNAIHQSSTSGTGGSIGGGHEAALFFGCAAAAAQGVGTMRSGSGVGSGAMSPRDNYASVRRENRELKLEVARMRMRLTDLEKDHVSMKRELVRVGPANRLLRGFTRSLGRLFRLRPAAEPGLQQLGAKATADAKVLFQRRRRHSIS